MSGLDRLTLANQIRAYWDEHNAFASTAKLRLVMMFILVYWRILT